MSEDTMQKAARRERVAAALTGKRDPMSEKARERLYLPWSATPFDDERGLGVEVTGCDGRMIAHVWQNAECGAAVIESVNERSALLAERDRLKAALIEAVTAISKSASGPYYDDRDYHRQVYDKGMAALGRSAT